MPPRIEPLEPHQLLSAVLLADLNDGPANANLGPAVVMGQTLYFIADDGIHGRELFKSDGTAAGTVLVKDIRLGPQGSNPAGLMQVNGTLYFAADDGLSGVELWKSDGNADGTVLVKDIVPGPDSSEPEQLTASGSKLFFVARTPETGQELWASDGSPDGTLLMRDTYAGFESSLTHSLTDMDGTLYFAAVAQGIGYELFASDGTPEGTILVRDISGGPPGSQPNNFFARDGVLYFGAATPNQGWEPWRSEGTPETTILIKDIRLGADSSYPSYFIDLNGMLLFSAWNHFAGAELWISDGTPGSASLLKDINPGTTGSHPYGLRRFGSVVLFTANDGVHGYELWKTDGTAPGTELLADLAPGEFPGGNGPVSSSPSPGLTIGGSYFFSASTQDTGAELFVTDGHATRLVKDIAPASEPSYATPMAVLGDSLIVAATEPDHGAELWIISPPNASAGGPYTMTAWPTLTLDATSSTDPDPDETLTYLWDLDGDGFFGETGPAAARGDELGLHPTFSAANDPALRSFDVSLRAINSAGLIDTASTTIQVTAPTVLAGANHVVGIFSPLAASGSFIDPDGASWTATVDYGDGAGPTPLALAPDKAFSLAHIYDTPGAYTVTVKVTNNLGQSGADAFAVTARGPTFPGTFTPDNFAIRFDTQAGLVHFFENAPLDGAPTFSIPLAHIDTVSVQGGIGTDALTVLTTPGNDVIDVNATRIALGGALSGITINLAGMEKLTVGTGDGDDTLAISALLPFGLTFDLGGGDNSLQLSSGARFSLPADPTGAVPLRVSVTGPGTQLIFLGSRSLTSLSFADQASAYTADGQKALTIRTNSFSITGGARLDLYASDLVVQATPATRQAVLAHVAAYIKSGALYSSREIRSAPHTGLAATLNDDGSGAPLFNTFEGVPVDTSSVLVKYTYDGDTDFNGRVNIDDYFRIDRAHANSAAATYRDGDFDLDGDADGDDYFLIDRAFLSQSGILSAAAPLPFALTPATTDPGSDPWDDQSPPANILDPTA